MGVMPDFAVAATFDGLLPEPVEDEILRRIGGVVIRHTPEGDTVVAVPFTEDGVLDAARGAATWMPTLAYLAKCDPRSFEVAPLD